ncbi:MAG TPA: oxygenase MpaB family protein [Candidatus Saccharimonadales bacterium]
MDTPVVANASGVLALTLQFAHPLVAAGLASTNKFQQDPRLRLQHAAAIEVLMGNDPVASRQLAQRLAALHARIKGELTTNVGPWKAGTRYIASDPELVLWVYTTLVVSRVTVFEAFHTSLCEGERDMFYRSTFTFGEHFGVKQDMRPTTYGALLDYYHATLPVLAVGSDGKELARSLLASLKPVYHVVRPVLTQLLPPQLRSEYDLPWGKWQKLQARVLTPAMPRLFPLIDQLLRL